MKKLLALLLMAPAIVFASSDIEYVQRTKGVYCSDWKTIEKVTKNFDEIRIGRGLGHLNQSGGKEIDLLIQTLLFVNAKTGTFTIVEKNSEGLWCVVSHGENFKLFPIDSNKK